MSIEYDDFVAVVAATAFEICGKLQSIAEKGEPPSEFVHWHSKENYRRFVVDLSKQIDTARGILSKRAG